MATPLVGAVFLIGVAAVAWWAGSNAVSTPSISAETHGTQRYRVEVGTIGRRVRVGISASWPTDRVIRAGGDGILTTVTHRAGEVAQGGDVIATVDLVPVVVAEGPIPMFRVLETAIQGPDVAQLQAFLGDLGFYDGDDHGRFDSATRSAVETWQRAIGAEPDGSVEPGSLAFIDHLPARLEVLGEVGDRIEPGAELLRVLASAPEFVALLSANARDELTSRMAVTIAAPDGSDWEGELTTFEPGETGGYVSSLTGSLCRDTCDLISPTGETVLAGLITLVPETEGLVVPTTALVQMPNGKLAVTLPDGTNRSVTIIAEADGFAVIRGLPPGTEIALPSPPT
jgi:peptidoglycan hydrolase-like protein with peptidoglycan-binding domain